MLEKGTLDDGRIVGGIGKIQNLSSSVGFITRTLEGRVDFKDNIYFRKETIEDNISSGIIDLRHVGSFSSLTQFFTKPDKCLPLASLSSLMPFEGQMTLDASGALQM